jgi:hypothetical protein
MEASGSRPETVLSFLIGGLLGVGLVVLSGRDIRRVLGSGDYCLSRSRWASFR